MEEMTLWEKRTSVVYKDDIIQQSLIKDSRNKVADIIDFANSFMDKWNFIDNWNSEKNRCISLAMTSFEEWLMWLIKWITKE